MNMELQEQVTALEAQIKQQTSIIDNLLAENKAIMQMYEKSNNELFLSKKDVIIKDSAINDLNKQIQKLLEEKATLGNDLEKVKSTLASVASDAQY